MSSQSTVRELKHDRCSLEIRELEEEKLPKTEEKFSQSFHSQKV